MLLHDTVVPDDSKSGLFYNCTYEVFRIFVSMVYVSGVNRGGCQILVIDLAGENLVFFKRFSANFLYNGSQRDADCFKVVLKSSTFTHVFSLTSMI
jgi:hypothetical protein